MRKLLNRIKQQINNKNNKIIKINSNNHKNKLKNNN